MFYKTNHGTYVIFTDQPEGNAISIISIVKDMIRQIWKDDPELEFRINNYIKEAMSGNYENLKKVSQDAVPGLIEFGISTDYTVTAIKKE